MVKLEFPEKKHKKEYLKMIKEWGEMEDLSFMSPGKLFNINGYEDFLKDIKNDLIKNDGVRAHLFFLINENNEILGGVQIRHHINHPNLIEIGGHIGYGIAPKFRKKGYATKMLKLALFEAKKLGIKKALLTCALDNIGSNKVIQKNGGIFERKNKDGDKNRYWIKV